MENNSDRHADAPTAVDPQRGTGCRKKSRDAMYATRSATSPTFVARRIAGLARGFSKRTCDGGWRGSARHSPCLVATRPVPVRNDSCDAFEPGVYWRRRDCGATTPSANTGPWYSTTLGGPQQQLAPLATGKPCQVSAIASNGSIVGTCASNAGIFYAVFWNAATPAAPPIAMNPLPGTFLFPLLRPADKQTMPTAQNQNGVVVARSLSANGVPTVVTYTAGSATPERVSGWGDNCAGVDLTETLFDGRPLILLNCPGPDGPPVIKVAKWNGGGYSFLVPALPTGATYCVAVDMNNQGQFVGTCVFPGTASDTRQTAFWNTPSSPPSLLTMPLNALNHAVAINDLGHVLAYGKDPTGFEKPLYWPDPTNSFTVQSIQPLQGNNLIRVAGFANNNTVALNCVNTSQYETGCFWTPSGGTVAIPPMTPGLTSYLNSISPSGTYAVGYATDAALNFDAVGATLP